METKKWNQIGLRHAASGIWIALKREKNLGFFRDEARKKRTLRVTETEIITGS